MRTNIVLDDDLLSEARKYSASRSKRELVREALATYVSVKAEQQRIAAYRDRLVMIRKRVSEMPVHSSARNLVRQDRERAS